MTYKNVYVIDSLNLLLKRENGEFVNVSFSSEMDLDCIASNWQNHEIILKLLWPRITAISWKMVALLVQFFFYNETRGKERDVETSGATI